MNQSTEVSTTSGSPVTKGWAVFDDLQQEMNRVFDRFFHRDPFKAIGLPTRIKGFDLSPTVDVTERPDSYEITAELPGVSEKDVSVTVDNGVLSISGEKKSEKTEETKDKHISERSYGSFQRVFSLPSDAEDSQIKADFSKGVLKLSIPRSKKPAPTARHIEIKTT